MKDTQSLTPSINRLQMLAVIVGLVALVAAVAGLEIGEPGPFFQAYLFSFVFWTGISLGSLALLLLHFLVGSRWGLTIRRITEAGASTLGLMAVLFIPLIFGLPYLYEWARPEAVAESALLQYKSFYLNVPFFIIRAAIYFAVWIVLATVVNRLVTRLGGVDDYALRKRLQGLGALGLILYGVTMTFASVDWLMSLQPEWTSSIYGLIVIIGQVLGGMAFALVMLNLVPGLSLGRRWSYATTPVPYRDLGALLLTLVMGWGYLAFFQLLIIWAGNIPREVTWYLARTEGGWLPVAVFLALFQLGLPFMALLTIRIRHNLRFLGLLGAGILFTLLVNDYWQVIPAFYPGTFTLHWLHIVMPLAIGGLWLAVFLTVLARRPSLTEPEQARITAGQAHEEAIP